MSLFTGGIAMASALAAAGASTVAAKMSTGAARDSAQINAEAQAKSLAAQQEANTNTLNFTKRQAEADFKNQEIARRGNYDQVAAQRARLGTLGAMLGLPAPEMPAYVASQDPNYEGTARAPVSSGGPAAAPTGNLSDPKAWMALVGNDPALASWVQKGLGPTADPGLVNYYVGKIKGQPGANPTEQAGSANYWLQKLQSDPNVTGRATAPLSPAAQSTTGTFGTMVQPYRVANPTAALAAPYQPGTLGRMVSY